MYEETFGAIAMVIALLVMELALEQYAVSLLLYYEVGFSVGLRLLGSQ